MNSLAEGKDVGIYFVDVHFEKWGQLIYMTISFKRVKISKPYFILRRLIGSATDMESFVAKCSITLKLLHIR